MFTKFLMTTALVGSVLATGANVSASNIARETTPPPPPPPVVLIDDYSAPERPGFAAYTVTCLGSTACLSLRTWCKKNGGTFTDWVGPQGTKGVCSA